MVRPTQPFENKRPKTLRELLPRASFFPAACEVIATTVCADASSVRPGGLYVLLDEFDASDADLAVKQGAAAIVAERLLPGIAAPLIVVDDAYDAHNVLRKALDTPSPIETKQVSPPLVLVAGSAGKSVTAKLIASIFATAGASTGLWTNTTTEVNGLALETKPSMPVDKQWQEWLTACDTEGAAIVAADPSQTELVSQLNPPATVACLTNLRADGLATDGSRRWKSNREHRAAICQALSQIDPNAPLTINADDADSVAFANRHAGPLLTFGEQPHADIFAMPLESFPGGQEFLVTSDTETAGVFVGTPGKAFSIQLPSGNRHRHRRRLRPNHLRSWHRTGLGTTGNARTGRLWTALPGGSRSGYASLGLTRRHCRSPTCRREDVRTSRSDYRAMHESPANKFPPHQKWPTEFLPRALPNQSTSSRPT